MPTHPNILFTAFEPSGDALAAGAIKGLLERCPDAHIWALAGPKSEDARATLIEESTVHAQMLLGAARQARTHMKRLRRLERWLADHPIDALVAVDSPAANWSVCKLVRRVQPNARILHLAAPQLWAWGGWRVGKLRRLTDLVMCLLPFEPDWFAQRGIPATFVGHPLANWVCRHEEACEAAPTLPDASGAKIALLPGSRAGEVTANWPTMLESWLELCRTHPDLTGVVAASDDATADLVKQLSNPILTTKPDAHPPRVIVGATDEAIEWADAVLVVSGTATLQVALRGKPMVVIYNLGWWTWQLLGRWLVQTRTFALPNLIAHHQGHAHPIPEFVPHFRDTAPIVKELKRLLDDPEARRGQRQIAQKIVSAFEGQRFSETVADQILSAISTPPATPNGQ